MTGLKEEVKGKAKGKIETHQKLENCFTKESAIGIEVPNYAGFSSLLIETFKNFGTFGQVATV